MYLKRGERKPIVTSSLDHFTEHWGEAGLGERLRKEEKGWAGSVMSRDRREI